MIIRHSLVILCPDHIFPLISKVVILMQVLEFLLFGSLTHSLNGDHSSSWIVLLHFQTLRLEKKVGKMMCGKVFLLNFEVFGNAVKQCFQCLT